MIAKLLIAARKCGTDAQYRAWVRTQKSCLSNQFSEYVNGDGRCLAAHVRRAGKSGIGTKAEFSCVPLTREEHDTQHHHGEAKCLSLHTPENLKIWTNDEAKEWFDNQRIWYLEKWIESKSR